MKEIKKVCFSEEVLQEKKKGTTTVSGMALVGSGSGESKKCGDFGSGRGVITSTYGGSWNANCSFYWTADMKYEKEMGVYVVTYLKIVFDDMRPYCEGTSSVNKVNGTCYETFNQEVEVRLDGYEEESSYGLQNVTFDLTSKPETFKVTITKYDKDGAPISSEIKEEKKCVVLRFYFVINDAIPEIRLRECEMC